MPDQTRPVFGIVAEGKTDQNVIDAILAGIFDDPSFEARRIRPLTTAPLGSPEGFGSWTNVIPFLESPQFEETFQEVGILVVHIDTDVCEELGVSRHEAGAITERSLLIDRVEAVLKSKIGAEVWARIGHQVVFAIPVDSIECWLLLIHDPNARKIREQNCLDHLNRTLAKDTRKKRLMISGDKSPRTYTDLAKAFDNPKELQRCAGKSPSLKRFLDNVAQALPPAPLAPETISQ